MKSSHRLHIKSSIEGVQEQLKRQYDIYVFLSDEAMITKLLWKVVLKESNNKSEVPYTISNNEQKLIKQYKLI